MLPEIEIPRVLPVSSLSLSGMTLLRKCPLKWKRRYIDGEYEPPSGKMICGSAAGAAEATNYQLKIVSGVDLSRDDVLDAYADEWNERVRRDEIAWGDDKPDDIRTTGQAALELYHDTIAPTVRPVSVEREFVLRFSEAEWTFKGFLDLEEDDGAVGDLKMKGKALSQAEADSDPQPSSYLLARRAEHHDGYGPAPAGFRFHVMTRTRRPAANVVTTERTDEQLDAFLHRIYAAAAEIHWRAEFEVWDGAPRDAWWCSQRSCGFWSSCPLGGAGRRVREAVAS